MASGPKKVWGRAVANESPALGASMRRAAQVVAALRAKPNAPLLDAVEEKAKQIVEHPDDHGDEQADDEHPADHAQREPKEQDDVE